MSALFEVLPGEEMPVSRVTTALREMWQEEFAPGGGDGGATQFRASQMNVILHFGLRTGPAEAEAQFQTALRFAQRYPCRILVLCPVEEAATAELLRGKLFAQCYLGGALRSRCCCEALMLSYPINEHGYLENQVSIWLESDLPVYHWFHRVPAARIRAAYLGFTKPFRRVVWDSSVEADDFRDLPWARPGMLSDLAWARLLPLRQSLGQFLSAHEPAALARGLRRVELTASAAHRGEAENLRGWVADALRACRAEARAAGPEPEIALAVGACAAAGGLAMRWHYDDARFLDLCLPAAGEVAVVRGDFGDGPRELPLRAAFLAPEAALSEALFF